MKMGDEYRRRNARRLFVKSVVDRELGLQDGRSLIDREVWHTSGRFSSLLRDVLGALMIVQGEVVDDLDRQRLVQAACGIIDAKIEHDEEEVAKRKALARKDDDNG